MAFETLELNIDELGVATLTLNRPEARNAMSPEMIGELRDALRQLASDDQVRVVVLTGAGEKVFCAGGDLKGMAGQLQATRQQRVADATQLADMLAEMDRLPRPLIGRINGSAFGGGLGLMSVCDLTIGLKSAKFALTEVRLGLIPATISPFVVARLGVTGSRRLMLGGVEMRGEEAARYGLLSEAVDDDQLDAAVDREVQRLLDRSR